MKKMVNRFYEWITHASVRRDGVNLPYKGKGFLYRYPSPGSIYQRQVPQDYKTPFPQSDYNVRMARPTDDQRAIRRIQNTENSVPIDPIRKLQLVGLLKQQERKDETKVSQAKKKFKQIYRYNVEDGNTIKQIPFPSFKGSSKEEITKNYEKYALGNFVEREHNFRSDHEWNNNPDVIQFHSLDMYDAPHFMQARVQNAYTLDKIIDARTTDQGMITKQGSANYWKALDDSHDPHNIEKVQAKIGDLQPTNFSLNNARVKLDFDKDGNVVNLHRIPQK